MRGRRSERGAALLVVMVAVAILTALSVQLAYDTRVELQLAGNARDRLRAEHLARSGVALSRLVLALQQQLDAASGAASNAAARAARAAGGGQPAGAAAAAAAAGLGAIPSIRLWSAVPVNSGLVQALFGGGVSSFGDREPPADGAPPPARFGDFEGMFAAEIEDEFSKVDVQLGTLLAQTSGRLRPQVIALWQLVCDPRFDPLFDREDANGVRVSRQDLLIHLRDWADEDEQTSSLAASFPGPACMIDTPPNPFEPGFGDEDLPYDRGEDRYKAKNGRLDSLDELYLVAGVSDTFMAAFGDRLTVYVPNNAKQTIDPRDPRALLLTASLIADPPGQERLYDPQFAILLHQAVQAQTMGGLLNIGPEFVQLVSALGVQVSADASNPTSPKNPIGDRSTVFRIRATGAAGDVEARIDAVVSLEASQPNQARAAQPGQNAGRLIRWREE